MNKKQETAIILYSRVAWLNRDTLEYNFGAWHLLSEKNPKQYKNLQCWVQQQNKKYPRTKYWLEMKDKKANVVKNSEAYELIPIVKEESADQYTEWLAL